MTLTIECPRCGHTRPIDTDAIKRGTWRTTPCPEVAPKQAGDGPVAGSLLDESAVLSARPQGPERACDAG